MLDGAFDPSQLIEAAADGMIDVWKKTQRRIHDHTQIPDWRKSKNNMPTL